MSDRIDHLFEARFRSAIRGVLSEENGPHPRWADSPAARGIRAAESNVRRLPPLRLLAIAAVLAVGGAAAAGAAIRLLPTIDTPSPTEPAPSLLVATEATPPAPRVPSRIAYMIDDWVHLRAVTGDGAFGEGTVASPGLCPQLGPNDTLAAIHNSAVANEQPWVLGIDTIGGGPGDGYMVSDPLNRDVCFEAAPDGERFAYLSPTFQDSEPPILGDLLSVASFVDEPLSNVILPETDVESGIGAFAWSADGSQLALVRHLTPKTANNWLSSEIWVHELATATERLVLTGAANESIQALAWSPDGSRIAYRGAVLNVSDLDQVLEARPIETFVRVVDVSAADSAPFEMDSSDGPTLIPDGGPAWSPDGTRLAWVAGGELRVGDVVSGDWQGQQPVSNAQLGTGWASDPVVWSPDGRLVLVGQLDQPFVDPDVQMSVVIYDLERGGQPMGLLPWREGDYGRISWEEVR